MFATFKRKLAREVYFSNHETKKSIFFYHDQEENRLCVKKQNKKRKVFEFARGANWKEISR